MITATPSTWTPTETLLTSASRWVLKMLISALTNRITAKIRNVSLEDALVVARS